MSIILAFFLACALCALLYLAIRFNEIKKHCEHFESELKLVSETLSKTREANESLGKRYERASTELKEVAGKLRLAVTKFRESQAELQTVQEKLRRDELSYRADIEIVTTRANSLEEKNRRLEKWSHVADAEEHVERMKDAASHQIAEAERRARGIVDIARIDAGKILAEAKTKEQRVVEETKRWIEDQKRAADQTVAAVRVRADSLFAEAVNEVKQARSMAAEIITSANSEHEKIVADARLQVESIMSEAAIADANMAKMRQTLRAIQNTIQGYGDDYLVSRHSIFDDLAEELGHTEASQHFKQAREHSKRLLKIRAAAECDYVETNRKETAINFVVDAFNGKVDSILARVKSDNIGTLRQEVRDAFLLVNHNGKAFREARITIEYLEARLEELRWAAIVHQIKLEIKEEQRRIKEKIREEERARKEYERVIKETAKEEELLRRSINDALKHLEAASSQQRAEYEAKVAELSQRLVEAESRNQRAISMAQQTKRGHVYIISNIGSFGDEVFKIGLTRRLDPTDRIRELGDASVPFEFDVHGLIFSEDAPALEKALHRRFVLKQVNKANFRKEFFRVSLQDICNEISTMQVDVSWTMMAAARQYRETLAIEQAIAGDPKLQEAWMNRQWELETLDQAESEIIDEDLE